MVRRWVVDSSVEYMCPRATKVGSSVSSTNAPQSPYTTTDAEEDDNEASTACSIPYRNWRAKRSHPELCCAGLCRPPEGVEETVPLSQHHIYTHTHYLFLNFLYCQFAHITATASTNSVLDRIAMTALALALLCASVRTFSNFGQVCEFQLPPRASAAATQPAPRKQLQPSRKQTKRRPHYSSQAIVANLLTSN